MTTRYITNIRKKRAKGKPISVAILAAGTGSKIKSYEPRSLIKIQGQCLVEHQINALDKSLPGADVITVVGCHAQRVVRKIKGRCRIVENQLHDKSNSSESLRLAFNNTTSDKFLFCHGDILFNPECLKVDYDKSFVIIDNSGMMKDNEVGITMNDGKLSIMSYGLPIKWGQIAYFTGKEHKMLRSILQKFEPKDKKRLSFEIINEIVMNGGSFECYDPTKKSLLEIDRIKDKDLWQI